MLKLSSIVHPTDFSDASAAAFGHALRIALTAKCTLNLVHVATAGGPAEWTAFPHIRATLARWGLSSEHDTPRAVAEKLGIRVAKVELEPQSPAGGILQYLAEHPADLIVLTTQGRDGVARWLHGSMAENLVRHGRTPALFVPAQARGFVDQKRGEVHLKRVLIPVDHDPPPAGAVNTIMDFAHLMSGTDAQDPLPEERLLHIGDRRPELKAHLKAHKMAAVAMRQGDVVPSILAAAAEWPPDLIGMPTYGRHGFLDAMRGSTTERVVRQSPCPVLAVPAGG
jgi:nucleotide-binding universal stress UspA family protein